MFRTAVKKHILSLSFGCNRGSRAGQKKSVNAPVVGDWPKPGHCLRWLSHTDVFTWKMFVIKMKRLDSWDEKWLTLCCLPVLCLNPRHVLPPCSLERRATRSLGSPAGNCSSRGKDFKATSDSQVSSSDCTFENPLNVFISQNGSACVFFLPTACFSSQWLSSQVKYIPFAQYILKSMNQKYVLFMKERIEFFFVNKKYN